MCLFLFYGEESLCMATTPQAFVHLSKKKKIQLNTFRLGAGHFAFEYVFWQMDRCVLLLAFCICFENLYLSFATNNYF